MSDKERLFAAYLAGFEEASEGFNGEYRNERYCGDYESSEGGRRFVAQMRKRFERWVTSEDKE